MYGRAKGDDPEVELIGPKDPGAAPPAPPADDPPVEPGDEPTGDPNPGESPGERGSDETSAAAWGVNLGTIAIDPPGVGLTLPHPGFSAPSPDEWIPTPSPDQSWWHILIATELAH